MGAGRSVLPFVLVAVGLVWIAQGVGLLRGSSFMVGDLRWALIGLGCVVLGLVIGMRRRRSSPGRRR